MASLCDSDSSDDGSVSKSHHKSLRGGFWAARGRLADLSVRGGALVISMSEPLRSDLWWLFDTEPLSELSLSQRLAKAAVKKLDVT